MENKIFKETEEKERKVISLLQLAKRAGKLVAGYDAVANSIKKKENKIIIISEDISERTKKKFMNSFENIKFYNLGTKDGFGTKLNSKPVGILCVTDKNFADGIKRIL